MRASLDLKLSRSYVLNGWRFRNNLKRILISGFWGLERASLRATTTTTSTTTKVTFCFYFQLIISGSVVKLLSLKKQSAAVKGCKLEPWSGGGASPGDRHHVMFFSASARTLALLPFESTQNYLHLRGDWTAHQSISKSQIFLWFLFSVKSSSPSGPPFSLPSWQWQITPLHGEIEN